MTWYVKVGNEAKIVSDPRVKVGNEAKLITRAYVKVGNEAKLFYSRDPIIDTFNASGMWTKRSGIMRVVVKGVHAGADGFRGSSSMGGNGGGGGGSFTLDFQASALPDSVPVVIGAGGINGGNSAFNAMGGGTGGQMRNGGMPGTAGFEGGAGRLVPNNLRIGGYGGGSAGLTGDGEDGTSDVGAAGPGGIGGDGGFGGGFPPANQGGDGESGGGGGGTGYTEVGGNNTPGIGGNGRIIVESWYF